MRPNWISYMLFSALAVTLTAIGCDTSAKGAIPDMSDAALEIVTNATFKSNSAPAPVTPDEKVPRAECKECKGTGTITHGDGHKTPCNNCFASAEHSCPCGPECQCENCPSDCLGELVRLDEVVASTELPLQLVANATAATRPSSNCANGQCELTPSGSGNGCTTEPGDAKGSCASGSCASGGGSCGSGAFMQGGPARRFISNARPLRRAAGFVNRVRPVRRLAGRLFGGCCR